MTELRSAVLFVITAVAEIGGAWMVWQGVREPWVAVLGRRECDRARVVRLRGDVAARPQLGRVLAAYCGVFVAGSLLWGVAFDAFRPDRWDLIGSAVCLLGVAVIMYAPRGA
ncbi:YnfA family protein [Saccharopolyspora elongata]|uniref:YnfA family protein n=1 Tax=Saccharopolyspora elongata TaxID=2530387 RepID=A0A4R4XUI8_9PSEU|nr:YnfA family protein [Saccharopolyspora elongata]TDD34930.1 YnfA family protein [Saccharopolyspora elongata]